VIPTVYHPHMFTGEFGGAGQPLTDGVGHLNFSAWFM